MASEIIQGEKAFKRLLDRLPDKALKVARGASNRAVEPIRKKMIRNAEETEESGLLAESIGKKTKTYKRFDLVTTNVGPRQGFKRLVDVPLNDFEIEFGGFLPGQTHTTEVRDPFNYAHLVEGFKSPAGAHKVGAGPKGKVFGHTIVSHPGIRRPRPFARPAFDSGKGETFSRYRKFLATGAVREAKKLAKAV